MSQDFASDIEAQRKPGSPDDFRRLKNEPPRYDRYIKSLDALKQRPELSEELFWYQELGSLGANKLEFQFSKDKKSRFQACRTELQRVLGEASKTSTASLQIWWENVPLVQSLRADCVAVVSWALRPYRTKYFHIRHGFVQWNSAVQLKLPRSRDMQLPRKLSKLGVICLIVHPRVFNVRKSWQDLNIYRCQSFDGNFFHI